MATTFHFIRDLERGLPMSLVMMTVEGLTVKGQIQAFYRVNYLWNIPLEPTLAQKVRRPRTTKAV